MERHRRASSRARFRELRDADRATSSIGRDAVLRAHRRRLDAAAAPRRLSHRLRHGARAGALAPLLVALVILPFWTSFLIRIYAWIAILKPEGLLNQALLGLGLIAEPLDILNTETAVYIGIVYAYLPFMVLPLYATLEKIDPR